MPAEIIGKLLDGAIVHTLAPARVLIGDWRWHPAPLRSTAA